MQHNFFLWLLEKSYLHYAVDNCFPGNVTFLQCRFEGCGLISLNLILTFSVMQLPMSSNRWMRFHIVPVTCLVNVLLFGFIQTTDLAVFDCVLSF